MGENPRESLSELAKLGARLIIQRAVEEEFDAWLGRARYERRPQAPPGLRNGFRPRRVQTGEGELEVEIPQVREAAEPFVSKLFPRGTKLLRTEPLKAMVIGAFVRGLSMRDVESLCDKAGLGKLSKSTASRICRELRDRFEAFKRRDLYDIQLAALFLDAVFLSVRRDGPKEGVLVAWGFTADGERVLLSVMLGMRESHEDWLALGRDLIARGLGAPMLIVADGAPGLIKAVEQCWPASDRQHCAVHRVRNLLAKLPERERERVRRAYWQALDEAADERDAKQRLEALVDELDRAGYTAAARCLADDLDALVVHLRYPTRHRRRWRSTNLLERSLGEVKRRTKVIGRFPGETSCLTLVWAVLDLYISHATNGIKFTQLERQTLKRMRYEGSEQPIPEEVTAA
ncbi:MAG: IS256 family transposase [Actinobacteria bacterium]|nr:IS256 family transposase [Actinomycetota bacterium]